MTADLTYRHTEQATDGSWTAKHFTREEFACKCGCGFCEPHPDLVAGLDMLRELIGRPVVINSGCRCPNHNRNVGGVVHSYHVVGKAADIICPPMGVDGLAGLAETILCFQVGGIIKEPTWVHVDVRGHKFRDDRRK